MNFEELIKIGKQCIDSRRVNRYIKKDDCICVIESASAKQYIGHSISLSNCSICAEQSALISMFNSGEYEIARMITVSKTGDIVPPCGKCLELLSQTNNSKDIEIALSKYVSKKLKDVYPYDWKRIDNYNLGMPLDNNDPFNLKRFIIAQDEYFDTALSEIENGKKMTHWIWYVFPIHRCLAKNVKSDYYGISSLEEAKAYYANNYLSNNLIVASNALLCLRTANLEDVVGERDEKKIHACLTLFYLVTSNQLFKELLDKYFNGILEKNTVNAINKEKNNE